MSMIRLAVDNTNTNAQPATPTVRPMPEFFGVEKLPISNKYGDITNKKAIVVNKRCINVVSNNYQVHQPAEIYNTFVSVAEKTGLQLNRVVPNKHNGGLLLSAKYADCKILGEAHDINLTFYTAHDGKYKTFLTLDLLRMACFNQIPALYRNKNRFIFAEKHYKNALDISLIQQCLEHIPATIEAYAEKAAALYDKPLDFNTFLDYYVKHNKLDPKSKQYTSKVAKLRSVYYNAPGQSGVTGENGYKAFQAITFLNTHDLRNTAMLEENRLVKSAKDSLIVLDELLAA